MDILKKLYHDTHYQKAKIETAADNLNRADIPGQKEKQLKEPSFKSRVMGANGLKQTNPQHLSGTAPQSSFQIEQHKGTLETDLDGNSIDPDKQHMTIADASTNISRNLAVLLALNNQRKAVFDR